MKKTITILTTLAVLVACTKEAPLVEEPTQEQNQTIKVNFNISRTSITNDTKAAVKTTWAKNDVVFIFFEGVEAPKYLELKYNSGNWVPTQYNGLVSGNLAASGKHLTAVYLPYGSNFTVAADGSSFTIKNGESNYSGHFFVCEKQEYTFDGSTLTSTINLSAAAPEDSDDRLVHFDVSGYNSGHEYDMYQDYMKPISLTSIALDGTVGKSVGSRGDAIPGYEDATFVSFSGVLDDTAAVGKTKDYQFSINDVTTSVLYTRDAGNRTVSDNMFIGLGTLSNTTTWNANEYVYLGFTNFKGERVMWAKKNLGATAETGEGSFGNYYTWGDLVGYALEGTTYPTYTCDHTFPINAPAINLDHFENLGEYSQKKLKPEYDPAHVTLKGLWRMPTGYQLPDGSKTVGELGLLGSETTRTLTGTVGTVVAGNTYTGKNGAYIFLPFSGEVTAGTNTYSSYDAPDWYFGCYISSVCVLKYVDGVATYQTNRYLEFWNACKKATSDHRGALTSLSSGTALSIRPVFSIK